MERGKGVRPPADTGAGRRLVVANNHSELRRASEWVREFARELRLERAFEHGLELALNEALTNIMSYAYQDGAPHDIVVALHAQPDRIRVEVEDDGIPFNPLDIPEHKPEESLEKSRVTGRGIVLMRSFMDQLQYSRRNGKNVLTMVLMLDA